MASPKGTQTLLQLVRLFVDKDVPILFWRDEWFMWNGTQYERVYREAIEQKAASFLEKHSQCSLTSHRIRSFVDLLRILRFCNHSSVPSWLNGAHRPDPRQLFAVRNGLLHITASSSTLIPHDAAFFGLATVAYDYRPTTRCTRWVHFLNDLWPDDRKAADLLQEWFGYCLLPDTSQQKMLAVIGPPASGKSTIARVLTALLGHRNVASPSIRSLSGEFGLWGLLKKSAAIVPDATLPRPCPALEELLKSISGEDAMDIHRKGMPPLTGVRLPTRIMILGNESPSFHDPSRALHRRLLTLRTARSFCGKEDIGLTEKLLKELPGILNWAITGWRRLHSRGHFETTANPTIDRRGLLQAVPNGDRVNRIVVYYDDSSSRRQRRQEHSQCDGCRSSKHRERFGRRRRRIGK